MQELCLSKCYKSVIQTRSVAQYPPVEPLSEPMLTQISVITGHNELTGLMGM